MPVVLLALLAALALGPLSAPALAAPAAPVAAAEVSGCTPFGVTLTWGPVAEAARYEVTMSPAGADYALLVGSVDPPGTSLFVDGDEHGLAEGQSYAFTVTAVDAAGDRTPSAPLAVTMPAPVAPSGAAGAFPGQLSWTGGEGCGFAVYRDGGDAPIATLAAGAASFTDPEPLHGTTTYTVYVLGPRGRSGTDGRDIVVSEPLPALGPQPTCAGADAPLTSRTLARAAMATVCLVNFERVSRGLQPVWLDARLSAAADGHARDQIARGFFDHVNPDGCDPGCRARGAGYPTGAGENIAMGYATPRDAVTGWMNSPGHRRNILDEGYRTIGTGTATGSGERQWVHTFGRVPAPLTAESGLEPAHQGASAPAGRVAARLRVTSVRLSAGRLRLRARISRRAAGGRVVVRLRGRGASRTYRVRVGRGRIALDARVPRRVARTRPLALTIRYGGNGTVRPQALRLTYR